MKNSSLKKFKKFEIEAIKTKKIVGGVGCPASGCTSSNDGMTHEGDYFDGSLYSYTDHLGQTAYCCQMLAIGGGDLNNPSVVSSIVRS